MKFISFNQQEKIKRCWLMGKEKEAAQAFIPSVFLPPDTLPILH